MANYILQPGDLGVDYSGWRGNLNLIKQSGGKFVLRYSAGVASDPTNPNNAKVKWKLVTPPEFKAIVAAGLDVIANDEWYADRVTEGYAAGHADGLAALHLWQACGLAKGATIYVSWDALPARGLWTKVQGYVKGYRAALAGYYDVDVYGGTGFLKWAINLHLIKYGWRPNAGSWSNDTLPYQPDTGTPAKRAALVKLALTKTPAAIWQTGNYWLEKNADENIILRVPVGSHFEALAAAAAPKPPAPKPKPVVNHIRDARLALEAASKAHPLNGPVGLAVRAALKLLRGIK